MYMLLSTVSAGDTSHVENSISVTDILCQHVEKESLLQS